MDDRARQVAEAIRRVFEAAVALRLPYGALRPAKAWAMGWCSSYRDMPSASDKAPIARCSSVLVAAGARCRRDGLDPRQLAIALGHAEHAHAVCYTERRGVR